MSLLDNNSIQVEIDINPIVNNNGPVGLTKHTRVNNHNNNDNNHNNDNDLFSKICVSFWFTVILSPVIICDMYFAINDKSCVNQTFDKMYINMFIYLIVNSVALSILVLEAYSIIFVFDYYDRLNEYTTRLSKLLSNIIIAFLFIWSIIGCVIYWNFMDKTICSKNINNYLFVKFVITIIVIASIILKNKIK